MYLLRVILHQSIQLSSNICFACLLRWLRAVPLEPYMQRFERECLPASDINLFLVNVVFVSVQVEYVVQKPNP
jgi:hypothetical protein